MSNSGQAPAVVDDAVQAASTADHLPRPPKRQRKDEEDGGGEEGNDDDSGELMQEDGHPSQFEFPFQQLKFKGVPARSAVFVFFGIRS